MPVFPDFVACLKGLEHKDFDLVVVAILPTLQPTLVEQLLRWGPRMLLLEKPLAINAQGVERLLTYMRVPYPNLVVAVNYTRRYLPVVLEPSLSCAVGH